MTESYVIDIANGNSLRNKTAIVLNKAGDSPQSPILRGLGMAIDLKFSTGTAAFEAKFGGESPPTDRILVFDQVNSLQYRYRAQAGYGNLGLPQDYDDPVQAILGVRVTGAHHVTGKEFQFWCEEDPLIELGFCTGSSIQSAWVARASEAYYGPEVYGLNFDPGLPDIIGVSGQDSSNPFFVVGNDSKILEFAVYDTRQVYPIDIPVRFMEDWKDEFNQKHYGGSLYVSIFEDGYAEDFQGPFIGNEYQADIKTTSSISVIVQDPMHEYRVWFRFRSELNDPYYVDKLVRFKIINAEILNRTFSTDIYENELPDIIRDSSGDYYWSGMSAFVAAYSIYSVMTIVDNNSVFLPLDDVTPFGPSWLNSWSLENGGEIKIKFRRDFSATEEEVFWETYVVERPNGAGTLPVDIEKSLYLRYIHNNTVDQYETLFRFIEPDGGGTGTGTGFVPPQVYLEFLNNEIQYKQAFVYTDKGSINLNLPIKNGDRHNISSILDVNADGEIHQEHVGLTLITENTARHLRTSPVPQQVRVRNFTTVSTGDTVDLTWDRSVRPDLDVTAPALTALGQTYSFLFAEAGYGVPASLILNGRKGMSRVLAPVPGGAASNYVNALTNISHPHESVFTAVYRIVITSGAATGEVADYIVEIPTWAGYTGTPDTGFNEGEVQAILYDRSFIVSSYPANLAFFFLTGNLGSMDFIANDDFLSNLGWYSISSIIDGTHTPLQLEYMLWEVDSGGNPVLNSYGPYDIARFIPQPTSLINETAIYDNVWRTGRLIDGPWVLPQAKIDYINHTIVFDYLTRYTLYVRFSVTNPLDKSQVIFDNPPVAGIEYDISRLFRDDTPKDLQPGMSVMATFLHSTGPHIVGVYSITNEFVDALQLNQLRGEA